MIKLHVKESSEKYYGLAYDGAEIVATTVAPTRQKALRDLVRHIPEGAAHAIDDDDSEFVAKTIDMLVELESGNESHKRFTLKAAIYPEPIASVLRVAAAVPIGYVTSYGNIARASGTSARVVGRVMATNPLYPIVPCHRVVGADLSLVGYGGSTSSTALQSKLARLAKEAKGCAERKNVLAGGVEFVVFPAEWAVKRFRDRHHAASRQRRLFA